MSGYGFGSVRRGVASALTGLAAACGGSEGTSGGTDLPNVDIGSIVGTYARVIIDGAAVPTTVQPGSCDPVRFRAGSMELRDDGTWQMRLKLFDAGGNERTLDDQGTFERADDELAFRSDASGDRFDASIDAPLVHYQYD